MSLLHSLKVRMKYSNRVRKAAEEMLTYVRRGVSFEIPNGNISDATTRAVLCLRETYPEQVEVMYQARGIIIGPLKKAMQKVGEEGWKNLEKGQYLPSAQLAPNHERFIDDQHAWAAMQGLNRDQEAAEGQRRQAERDRLVMSGEGVLAAERNAVPKRALTPEELLDRAAEAALQKKAIEDEAARRAKVAASGGPLPRGGAQPRAAFIDEATSTSPATPLEQKGAPLPSNPNITVE
ncbi:MAG: hypothetical protein EPN91_08455 [Salinibacterium sp.]|nr:MAG: hypothetical protein EPN91_08455 [Salinibacterium sp.]